MSYTPTEWQTGDTITAEKLNNMEDGIEKANNPFIVTLTPAAQDFSGTMDKTVGEIKAAYKAGREIKLRVSTDATSYIEVPASSMSVDANDDTLQFSAYVIDTANDLIMVAFNSGLGDEIDTYSTELFPLTPMS